MQSPGGMVKTAGVMRPVRGWAVDCIRMGPFGCGHRVEKPKVLITIQFTAPGGGKSSLKSLRIARCAIFFVSREFLLAD